MSFLDMDEYDVHSKQDYYLAQIAAEIRQFRECFAKTPRTITLKEFLLSRNEGNVENSAPEPTPLPEPKVVVSEEDRQTLLDQTKANWAHRLGLASLSEIQAG